MKVISLLCRCLTDERYKLEDQETYPGFQRQMPRSLQFPWPSRVGRFCSQKGEGRVFRFQEEGILSWLWMNLVPTHHQSTNCQGLQASPPRLGLQRSARLSIGWGVLLPSKVPVQESCIDTGRVAKKPFRKKKKKNLPWTRLLKFPLQVLKVKLTSVRTSLPVFKRAPV